MNRKHVLLALSFLLIPPIGLLDQITGSDLSLIAFYFIPLVLASWYGGLAYGGAAAFLAIVTWVLSNIAFPTHVDLPRAVMLIWGVAEKAIFFALVTATVWKLHTLLDREKYQAMTDFVTRLPNRRAFAAAIVRIIGEAQPFSLAFMELDGLEDIYLDRGELFVDRLLFEMASAGRELVLGYRYSDQRFAALFPETSGSTAVKKMSALMAMLDRDVLETRALDLKFKIGIAYCQNASQVSVPHLIRFLAGSMIFLHGREGDQLEFFQFN
ncbi:MAG: GGDEF domain-containing protein [Rectinemataceae bacterium]